MATEPVKATTQWAALDRELMEELFSAAAGLMLAVHTTVTEDPDRHSYIETVVQAALDPPDQFKPHLEDFANLFGFIAGIFLQAAQGKLDENYPNPVPAEGPKPPEDNQKKSSDSDENPDWPIYVA